MRDFLNYLLHFWAPPPTSLELTCPPAPGADPPDLIGYYDSGTVMSAYTTTGILSIGVVIALTLICYLWTRTSLGPRFTRRWFLFLVTAALLCAIVPFWLYAAPTTALQGSCENSPSAFDRMLPESLIFARAVAGFAWGLIGFFLVSLLLTKTLGRLPWSKGLFHNSGCPWPRINPLAE